MGVFYEEIPESMLEWINEQKCFWIATAPLNGGHVNVSPKGGPYFGVPSQRQFWYIDLTGSGNETISHLHEPGNGRITIMFNSFQGGPRILRLWGHGTVLENGTDKFKSYVAEHGIKTITGTRSVIVVDIHQVGSSCGFSVPMYEFKEFRPTLNNFAAKKEAQIQAGKSDASWDHYWAYKNSYSIDGLPGMKRALTAGKTLSVEPIQKMVGALVPKNSQSYLSSTGGFGVLHLILFLLVGVLIGFGTAVWAPLAQERVKEVVTPVLLNARTRIGSIQVPSPAQILKR